MLGIVMAVKDRELTPLDAARTVKALPAGEAGGKPQIWQAWSVDGRWMFDRVEVPTTPWRVEYLPTGQDQFFGTLADGRRWTADEPNAQRFLLDRAAAVVTAGGRSETIVRTLGPGGRLMLVPERPELVRERFLVACRAVALLEGKMADTEPDTRCTCRGMACSGYLCDIPGPADPDTGRLTTRWVSADACADCVGGDLNERRLCGLLTPHRACPEPEPLLCEHVRCSAPVDPLAGPCAVGYDGCCSCCLGA